MNSSQVLREKLILSNQNIPPGYYEKGTKNNLLKRFWHTRRFEAIFPLIKKEKGRLLDVGCADGFLTNKIKEESSPTEVFAIDINENNLRYAALKYKDIRFVYNNIEDLSFDNNFLP